MHPTKPLWILLAAAILSGAFVVGYSVGTDTAQDPTAPESAGYRAGFEAARQKIADSGLLPPSSATITSVNGIIASTTDSSITINAGPVSSNPLDPTGPLTRTITVNEQTRVTRIVPLSDKEFRDRLAEFNRLTAAGKTASPPQPFAEEPAKFSDLAVGMNITATASADIRDTQAFTATQITFQ
jgi:hypothetical protein